ncbi:DUF2860 family protein [Motilimonas sp. KMU-193]|uniref:DUF2860 family protein n=1 Tax=Motilimonas sp. KMU-193 TaxID=3388668 RepID=UPI00396B3F6A
MSNHAKFKASRICKSLCLALTASTLTLAPTLAFADLAKEPGFDFVLNLNIGAGEVSSQLNTDKKNAITKDLNNNGHSLSGIDAFVLGRLSYTLSNKKTQFYLGNSEDDVVLGDFKVELGVSQEFDNGTVFSLAYVPLLSVSDAWQDPFLVNQKRRKTDVKSQGLRMSFENLFSLPLKVRYSWAEAEYDKERSGYSDPLNLTPEQQALLVRDSHYHQAYVEYAFEISEGIVIQPGLTYTLGDAKGKAMRYDNVELQLPLLTLISERSYLATSVLVGQANYDERHPVFNKVRKDNEFGVFAFYSYSEPFDWENTTFTAMATYSEKDSNINFYDEEGVAASIGMAYAF